jgi:hypothetical protein
VEENLTHASFKKRTNNHMLVSINVASCTDIYNLSYQHCLNSETDSNAIFFSSPAAFRRSIAGASAANQPDRRPEMENIPGCS